MIINHNLQGANAISKMNANSASASKSMQKLSSGLRINGAADDAAGLAISEKMRGQIRGLDQASANAQDSISMIQTAEGALGETESILQRMRELSVQSANDTNVTVDRSEIQKEMDELAKEITRISNNTEFNTQKLINGGISDSGVGSAKFHIGANSGQDITLSIGAMDAKSLGVSRDVLTAGVDETNAAGVSSATVDTVDVKKTLTAGDYTVKVTETTASSNIDVGTTGITGTTASGAPSKAFSVTFTYNEAEKDGAGIQIATGTSLSSGSTVTNAATALSITRGTGGAGAVTSASAGNYQLTFTDNDSYTITKADADGDYNITVGSGDITSANTTLVTGMSISVAAAKGDTYAAGDSMSFSIKADTAARWTTSDVSGDTFKSVYTATSSSSADVASIDANGVTIDLSQATGMGDGESITISGGNTKAQLLTADGENTIGESVYIDKEAGGTYTLGESTLYGQAKVTFKEGEAKDGESTITVGETKAKAAELKSGTMSDATTTAGLDVSTQSAASASITKIQSAIEKVSGERSKLGAYQNRLEHTIANLGTSSENLTSAESRIRDVDMAKEMSSYSKNNILSQAAQAMLAQANQTPQQVLQLLR